MKRLWACLLCLASVGAAADAPDDYAYTLPLEGIAGDALYRVAVPRVVHEAATFADLRDLRVFDGAGKVVPHALRPLEQASEKPAPVALPFHALNGPRGARVEDLDLALESTAGRASLKVRSRYTAAGQWVLLGYLVDASQMKAPLSGLDLDWIGAGDSYLAAVRVEGSDDLRLWSPLAADAQLARLSRGAHRLERKAIEFPPSRAKYLRVSWNDPARAVELKAVLGILAERTVRPERVWKRIVATPDAARSGEYRIDVGGLFPLDRLALRLPQDDTVVPIEFLSRAATADEWNPVARAVAYRVKQGGLEIASTDIAFAPNPHRYWLLRVDETGGGIGAQALIARAGWISREIVFAARGTGPFSLAYGNAKAKANAVPIETLVPDWRPDQELNLPVATSGAPRGLASAAAVQRRDDAGQWSLWAALFVGLAALVWLSWRRRRQARRSEEGPS
jgi:hypothetical protein